MSPPERRLSVAVPADRSPAPVAAAKQLAQVGRWASDQGWVRATGGNFSAVLGRDPLRLAVTATGVDKGTLTLQDVVVVDERGETVGSRRRASAEVLLHVLLASARDAGAVLHTHSVWGTLASAQYADAGLMELGPYEMLKALSGVTSHEHRERLPVVANSQDMPRLVRAAEGVLAEHPRAHGFLVAGHGLYTWGGDVREAARHLDALEFLIEVQMRAQSARLGTTT